MHIWISTYADFDFLFFAYVDFITLSKNKDAVQQLL